MTEAILHEPKECGFSLAFEGAGHADALRSIEERRELRPVHDIAEEDVLLLVLRGVVTEKACGDQVYVAPRHAAECSLYHRRWVVDPAEAMSESVLGEGSLKSLKSLTLRVGCGASRGSPRESTLGSLLAATRSGYIGALNLHRVGVTRARRTSPRRAA